MAKQGPKYQVNYTLKDKANPGFNRREFYTLEKAEKWIKKNEDTFYWHEFVEINAASKWPKPVVESVGPEYQMKIGTLGTHFETGMECMGLVLNEDGIHGGPNPNFDPTKPEGGSNFRNYASYDALNFIGRDQFLKIGDGPIIEIIRDRDFGVRDGFRLSFYPSGFSRKELLQLFGPNNIKATLWVKKEIK